MKTFSWIRAGLLTFLCFYNLNLLANEPIEIAVPFPPGGTVDIIARGLQQELQKRLPDTNLTVVNRPGGDGIIATQSWLNGSGNSILMTSTGTSLFLKLTNSNPGFDPINDFIIQGPLATASTVLAVNAKSKISALTEFIALAKNQNVTCGTSNAMAVFFGQYLIKEYNLKLTLVQYKGSAPAAMDLVGGHIDCAIDVLPVYLNRTDTRVIGLSVLDATGNFEAPVLSRGTYKFENFYALSIHRKMESRLKDRLINAIISISKDPQFIKSMAARGIMVNQNYSMAINDRLNREYDYLINLKKMFTDRGQ